MRTLRKGISLVDFLVQRIAIKYIHIKTMLFYQLLFGKIGQHSLIYKPLRLINPQNVFVGDRVYLYKHSRIETIEKWGTVLYTPKISIGNRVSVEQRLHLTCAKIVEIGDDTVILPDVTITDINHSFKEININVMKQPLEVKETIIGKCCFIGMGARIMAGTRLGNNCIVGSNAVISGEYDGYMVLAGVPAKIIKRYDFELNRWRKTNNKGEFIDEI